MTVRTLAHMRRLLAHYDEVIRYETTSKTEQRLIVRLGELGEVKWDYLVEREDVMYAYPIETPEETR